MGTGMKDQLKYDFKSLMRNYTNRKQKMEGIKRVKLREVSYSMWKAERGKELETIQRFYA